MTDYRALLRDRKSKSSSHNVEHEYCLAPDLIVELEDLQAERNRIAAPFTAQISAARMDSKDRLAGPDLTAVEADRDAATADLDGQIEAKETEIRDNTVILHFATIGPKYSELTTAYKIGTPEADWVGFIMALLPASFVKVTDLDGVAVEGSWADVMAGGPNDGELGSMAKKVTNANTIPVDLPFSLRPSGKTRTRK